MKANIISNVEKQEFTPFKIEITVESIEEARGLYHLANAAPNKILNIIRQVMGEDDSKLYSHYVLKDDLWEKIRTQIKMQGFEI